MKQKPVEGPRPRVYANDRFDEMADEGTFTRQEIREARK